MSIILQGSTSGSITLQEPAVAGTTVIDLPATSGTMVVTGGAQTIEFADGSAATPSITNSGDTNTGIFFPAADTIAFTEGGVESMRIDSSGNLLVGQTAVSNSERLSVRQASSSNLTGIILGYSTTAGEFRSMSIISTNAMTFNNGINEAQLSSAGAWTNASDARLKNSIVDIKYGLQTVLNTQPRSYKMNNLEGDYIGFVAQELQIVIPEVVSGDPETQLGVDYGSLVAVAFKAIQELKAELDATKAEVQALKGVA
jgi:hypothetical protein